MKKTKDIRVIMVGAGEDYHLEPVARCLKRYDANLKLGALGLWGYDKDRNRLFKNQSHFFDDCFLLSSMRIRNQQVKKINLNKSSQVTIPQKIEKKRSGLVREIRRFLQISKSFLSLLRRKKEFCRIVESYELIHLQSLFLGDAHYQLLMNSDKPFVVSCWGSDVLRCSELATIAVQKTILQKASAITVTGIEFKEIILAKYGRDLEPKIVNTYFNPSVDPILEAKSTHRSDGILRVCVGHNGFKQNNHKELLEEIASLPPLLKARLELLIPMTYGASESYFEDVRSCAKNSGCKFRIFDKFMTDDEVINLRLKTDILLYAPVSDAFSATVTQALAAGSVVIAGAWLPYKTRVMDGFKYHEIYKLSDIGEKLIDVLGNWEDESRRVEVNKELSRKIFSEEAIGKGWVDAYQLAIENFKNKKNG